MKLIIIGPAGEGDIALKFLKGLPKDTVLNDYRTGDSCPPDQPPSTENWIACAYDTRQMSISFLSGADVVIQGVVDDEGEVLWAIHTYHEKVDQT